MGNDRALKMSKLGSFFRTPYPLINIGPYQKLRVENRPMAGFQPWISVTSFSQICLFVCLLVCLLICLFI